MHMKRIRLVLALCLYAITTALPALADCSRPQSAKTALKHADLVFRGTVRYMSTAGEPTWRYVPFPRAVAEWHAWVVALDVSEVWKGSVSKRFILHVAQEQEDDAFSDFQLGPEYLVFALRNSPQKTAIFHVPEPTYGVTGCGGTMPVVLRTEKYLGELGPGKKPE
jgi:hypothetical protein